MPSKIRPFSNDDFITDIKALRIFTVEKKGDVVYLQRFKIGKETTKDEIQRIISLIEVGRMCFKHGHKRDANIKYAINASNPLGKVEKVVLVKIIKPEDEKIKTEDKVEIDIATGEEVADKLETMSAEEMSILQKIKQKLIQIFGLEVITKQDKGVPTKAVSERKITKSDTTGTQKISSTVKPKTTAASKSRSSKVIVAEEEQANQDIRKQKREAQKLSEELDQKFDDRLRKDIKSAEKRSRIVKEDEIL